MSLPARLYDFQPNAVIKSQEHDDELNQIINLLSGQNIGKSIRVVNSDNAFACARFDQTGNNDILQLFANGAEAVAIEKTGEILSIHTDIHDGFNADKLDGKHLSDIITTVTKSWLYTVLPGAVETTESQPRFIVPTNGVNKITKIYAVWAAGADSGASNIFTIKRRNSAGAVQSDVGTINVNTPAQNALHNDTTGLPVTLTAGDQIYPLFTTRNTASEQMVTISIEITVQPT